MMTPPARFCNCPLNAIPTARPIEANTAARLTLFTPKMLMMAMPTAIYNSAMTMELMRDTATPPKWRRFIMFLINLAIPLMTHRATKKKMSASNTRMPKLMRPSFQLSSKDKNLCSLICIGFAIPETISFVGLSLLVTSIK